MRSIVGDNDAGGSVVRSTTFIRPGDPRTSQSKVGGLIQEEIQLGSRFLLNPALLDVLGDAHYGEPWHLIAAAHPYSLSDRVSALPEHATSV